MFQTIVVQPLINLLIFITAVLPRHNFGVAIIIFTFIMSIVTLPLLRKQLHHAKAMKELQPEIKKIKAATKGDKQKESMLMMELYKEKQVSPFSSLGIIIVRLIILFGLYAGLKKIIDNPQAIIDLSYSFIRNLPWVKEFAANPNVFDSTFLGVVDLTKPAVSNGVIYVPGLILVIGSAIAQYLQSKQLMPVDKDARKLRQILKDASAGKQADQAEVNAAIGRTTKYIIPVMILFFTISIASALNLYWFVSGMLAFYLQSRILKQDEEEMEEIADQPEEKKIIEGEVITKKKPKPKKKTSTNKAKKRRKR